MTAQRDVLGRGFPVEAGLYQPQPGGLRPVHQVVGVDQRVPNLIIRQSGQVVHAGGVPQRSKVESWF